jgi:glycosyltransferase involved in cell wall biosynthesis
MRRRKLLLVSPRPPRSDGKGDQRRAYEIWEALSFEWDVEVLSWLPDVDGEIKLDLSTRVVGLTRALFMAIGRPFQVSYVQGFAPRRARLRLADNVNQDLTVFVTNRVVPRSVPERALLDFIDDIGGQAERRARSSRGVRALFWSCEAYRTRRLDRLLAKRVAISVAHSPADAAAISPLVRFIPLSVGTPAMEEQGDRIAFMGNLFYEPNHEAATWICESLVPHLRMLGVAPDRVVIAGRQPRPSLKELAGRVGADLRADVVDLDEVLREAAVVIAPMSLGSGAQYKVIDAVGAGRPCVISDIANSGLGLVDGQSALIRDRMSAASFAEAIVSLSRDVALRNRLVSNARQQLAAFMPEVVAGAWRAAAREVADRGGALVP